MNAQDLIYLLLIGLLAYWLFNALKGPSYLVEELSAEGLTNFGREWYWPSYWYNTYWPFYRRRYYDSYPYGYFPYQSYYSTNYF